MLLAVPFLFLFALAMLDFARGYSQGLRAHRAARHLAWAAGRREEDPSSPEPPTAQVLKDLHFRGEGPVPTPESHSETLDSPVPALPIPEIPPPFTEIFDLRGLPDFVTGRMDATSASVGRPVEGVRLMPAASVKSAHVVSLRARRESDPSDPLGWGDPFQWLRDQFAGIIPD